MHARPIGRWGLVIAGVGALTVACAPLKKSPLPLHTATFDCTNGAQTWVVPAGVTQATFDLYGAQGGTGAAANPFAGGSGGLGGRSAATLPVTPGESIQVNVGCRGGDGGTPTGSGPGGFGGGGAGGIGDVIGPAPPGGPGAAGGGGATDVRRSGSALGNRILVAGGGGGGGGADPVPEPGPMSGPGKPGGAGGFPFGEKGGGIGGNGGDQTTGGQSGIGCFPDATCHGSLGQGGTGDPSSGGLGPGAGGGGGGLYGGGGGGSSNTGGSGGGGGSSSALGVAGPAFEDGARAGNGLALISYRA